MASVIRPVFVWPVIAVVCSIWFVAFYGRANTPEWQIEDQVSNCNQSKRDDDLNFYGQIQRDHLSECRSIVDRQAGKSDTNGRSIAMVPPIALIILSAAIQLGLRQRRLNEVVLEGIAKPRWEIIVGDTFKNIHNANIFNKSTFEQAVKVNENRDPELAVALGAIAKIVNKSGSKDAADALNDLNSELSRNVVSKGVVRNIWETLTMVLPTVKDSAEAVEAITKIINPM